MQFSRGDSDRNLNLNVSSNADFRAWIWFSDSLKMIIEKFPDTGRIETRTRLVSAPRPRVSSVRNSGSNIERRLCEWLIGLAYPILLQIQSKRWTATYITFVEWPLVELSPGVESPLKRARWTKLTGHVLPLWIQTVTTKGIWNYKRSVLAQISSKSSGFQVVRLIDELHSLWDTFLC